MSSYYAASGMSPALQTVQREAVGRHACGGGDGAGRTHGAQRHVSAVQTALLVHRARGTSNWQRATPASRGLGRAVQVAPIKPELKAPGSKPLNI
jgi:hypothetical protein